MLSAQGEGQQGGQAPRPLPEPPTDQAPLPAAWRGPGDLRLGRLISIRARAVLFLRRRLIAYQARTWARAVLHEFAVRFAERESSDLNDVDGEWWASDED